MNPTTEKDIRKKRHTVDSLFISDVSNLLIRCSFYLPIDVLTDPNYDIQPIKKFTHAEFLTWLDGVTNNDVEFDGHEALVCHARMVAVSTRTSRHGTVHVCKVWYGDGVPV